MTDQWSEKIVGGDHAALPRSDVPQDPQTYRAFVLFGVEHGERNEPLVPDLIGVSLLT